jgi:ABC-type uncharacterized transport system permease subunit
MNTPQPPVAVSHTAEMIIATVFGVMYALKTGDYFVGIFLGILAGVVLSVLHTWIAARRRNRE